MPDLNVVSYCGLHCGSCFLLHDRVADQALALLGKFKEIGFEKWGPGLAEVNGELKAFGQAAECCRALEAWDQMRCLQPCRAGGGSGGCKIRVCCQGKQLSGCWECPECFHCALLDELRQVNGEMHFEHIRDIRSQGLEACLRKWTAEKPGKAFRA
ncbi:MAG: DUF3795 domain-containing protein [candidate division FCPU426 bacterium]